MRRFLAVASSDVKYSLNKQLEKMMKGAMSENVKHESIYQDDFVQFFQSNVNLHSENEENRYEIVFTGEIYNKHELKDKLEKRGATFNRLIENEIVLYTFHYYGVDCVNLFQGKFAFLIWDKKERKLFGARDPFGIKPLFYRKMQKDTHLFATEKWALLQAKENNFIDGESLFHFLTFQYVPEPQTAVMQIKRIEPGQYFFWQPGEALMIETYFKPQFAAKEPLNKTVSRFLFYPFMKKQRENEKNEVCRTIRETLQQSVISHMQGEERVGAFLSGGIDSTAIVAIAKQFQPKLDTFTAEFAVDGYSEGDVAEKTAEILGVNNVRVTITPDDIMNELPTIIRHMDEPVADPAAVPLYFVAKEASHHVKGTLSGEGADELFGGYRIYLEPQALLPFKLIPRPIKALVRSVAELLPQGMKGRGYLIRGSTPIEERYVGNAKIFEWNEKETFLIPGSVNWDASSIMKNLYDEARDYDDVAKMQYIDMHTWLPGDILVKANRMTTAHQIELRTPFLTTEMFQVASRLPKRGKVKGNETKVWLREALKDIVPEHVLYRKKLGFPVPIRHWLKDEMYDWAREWIKNSDADHLFHKKACLKLLEDHRNDKLDASRKIWTIITYIIWHRQFVESCQMKNNRLFQVI